MNIDNVIGDMCVYCISVINVINALEYDSVFLVDE